MSLRQLLSRHTRVPIILSSRTYIGLPDEVQMLKDMTRTFAEQELAPIAGKIDKGRVRQGTFFSERTCSQKCSTNRTH